MHLLKTDVTAKLRADGDYDRAHQAETTLPRLIDTDRDASLLHLFGLNVRDLDTDLPPAA